ncbi:MAG: hypothetical protein M0Z52_07345 [Actinomycetota bacterium]|nr:hypothetical protein [Actinomycetota bacterium]
MLLKHVSAYKPLTIRDLVREIDENPGIMDVKGMKDFDPKSWEIIFQPIYDRVQYPAAGTTAISFFAKQLGASDTLNTSGTSGTRQKNLRDTNLQQPNQLSDQAFLCMGWQIGYLPLSTGIAATSMLNYQDDMAKIAGGSSLTVKFINKEYGNDFLMNVPSPFSQKGSMAVAMYGQTAATEHVIGGPGGYGEGKLTSSRPMDPPYLIGMGVGFYANVTCDGTALSSSNPMDLFFQFLGYRIRPKQ